MSNLAFMVFNVDRNKRQEPTTRSRLLPQIRSQRRLLRREKWDFFVKFQSQILNHSIIQGIFHCASVAVRRTCDAFGPKNRRIGEESMNKAKVQLHSDDLSSIRGEKNLRKEDWKSHKEESQLQRCWWAQSMNKGTSTDSKVGPFFNAITDTSELIILLPIPILNWSILTFPDRSRWLSLTIEVTESSAS